MPHETNEFQSRLENLRSRFIARMHDDRQNIAGAWEQGDRSSIREITHKLSGIAGSFGFTDVGQAAADLYYRLDEATDNQKLTQLVNKLFDVIDGHQTELKTLE